MGRQFCQPPDMELQGSNCNVISILASQTIDSSINYFDAPIAPILPLSQGENCTCNSDNLGYKDAMMSSTNEEDPFLQVQQDVLSQLSQTRSLFTSFLRIRSLTTSSTSPELASARDDFESSLSTLTEDLADLQAAVAAVETNPSQYGLSAAEVTRRKRFVQETNGEVEDMREEAKKQPTQGAQGDLPDPSNFALQDDAYEEFEQQQQMQIMRDQDDQLEGVSTTVGNLRRQADDMGRELEEQGQMLEVVDDTVERVGGRLSSGMQKLNHVVRRNEDTLSSCCIAVLIFALIVLLVLLLIL